MMIQSDNINVLNDLQMFLKMFFTYQIHAFYYWIFRLKHSIN
jgi:hypothetical protein